MSNLQDLLNSPNNRVFSTNDLEEIFFGAIIGGVVEADEFTKVKREFFAFKDTQRLYAIVEKCINSTSYIDFIYIMSELSAQIGSHEAKLYIDKIVGKVPQELVLSSIIESLESNYIRRETSKILDGAKASIQSNPQHALEYISQLNDAI
jgi:replicative DNA helicase